MSKAKELYIIGAIAATAAAAIGYSFYKNNENSKNESKNVNRKETLIESASSAMDMKEHGTDSPGNSAKDTFFYVPSYTKQETKKKGEVPAKKNEY